jgi:hypothetical protein
MLPNYQKLQEMSDATLVEHYNSLAKRTSPGTDFYLQELVRRQVSRDSSRMLGMTKAITRLTWFIAILTVVNVVAVVAPWLKGSPA